MNRPIGLKPGDRVAVIAPASPVKEGLKETLDKVSANIIAYGYEPIIYPSCYEKYGYLAGTDECRVKDIHDAFSDPSIGGIICLRGGYGSPRLLKSLDYELIRHNPKVFLGYSDITALHMVINQRCDLVTYHGPMGPDLRHDSYSEKSLRCHLDGSYLGASFENPDNQPMEMVTKGTCKGLLCGGNLSLLVATLGSPYEIDTKDKILFIEEVDEDIYAIDRMFNALALAGKFQDCKGIILGTWSACDPGDYQMSLEMAIKTLIQPYGHPLVNGLQAGHIYPQMTLAMGEMVEMRVTDSDVRIRYIKE